LSGDNVAPQIAHLKGESDAVRKASIQKKCSQALGWAPQIGLSRALYVPGPKMRPDQDKPLKQKGATMGALRKNFQLDS
jgi:hypothetical protein